MSALLRVLLVVLRISGFSLNQTEVEPIAYLVQGRKGLVQAVVAFGIVMLIIGVWVALLTWMLW